MQVQFSFQTIFLIVGIAQGIFLSVVLMLTRKGNVKANRLLSVFIFVFSIMLISDVLYDSKLLLSYPHMLLVLDPLIFMLAPLCYFYVKALINKNWNFKVKYLFHFSPSVITYILFIPIYFFNASTKQKLVIEDYNKGKTSPDIFLVIVAIQILIYFIICIIILRKHQQNIKNYFSYREKVNLNWLKIFLIVDSILWISFVLLNLFPVPILANIDDILSPVAFYLIGYFGLKQPEIFFYQTEDIDSVKDKDLKKYAGTFLPDETAEEYLNKVLKTMTEKKLYLKNDLKLADLADETSLQTHLISRVLNEKLSKNFNDFVNEFRVEEIKKKLTDPQYDNITILGIGLESGFSSKSSINSVFKNLTGITPSEYKRKSSPEL